MTAMMSSTSSLLPRKIGLLSCSFLGTMSRMGRLYNVMMKVSLKT